jgi:hypothetical protein
MRKLALALLLIGAITLPVAAEITFSGDLTFGAILDFADPEADSAEPGFNAAMAAGYAQTATVDVKATVDDYNYAQVSIRKQSGVVAIELEEAYIRTNIFGALMMELPLTLTTWFGYTSASDASYVSTSEYGYENVGNGGTGTAWIVRADAVLADLGLTVRFGWAPGTSVKITKPETDDDVQSAGNWMLGAMFAKTIDAISFAAEVVYDNAAGDLLGDGDLIIDGEFKMTVAEDIKLDIGAGIRLEMGDMYQDPAEADPTADAKETIMYYGVGVGFDYGTLFGVAVGILGPSLDESTVASSTATVGNANDTDAAIDLIGIDVTLDPIDLLDIRAAVRLSLDPEKENAAGDAQGMFRGADIAAILNLGKAKFYVGYLVTEFGEGGTWAPGPVQGVDNANVDTFGINNGLNRLRDGGPYFKVDIDY